jgi:hypothetical protein
MGLSQKEFVEMVETAYRKNPIDPGDYDAEFRIPFALARRLKGIAAAVSLPDGSRVIMDRVDPAWFKRITTSVDDSDGFFEEYCVQWARCVPEGVSPLAAAARATKDCKLLPGFWPSETFRRDASRLYAMGRQLAPTGTFYLPCHETGNILEIGAMQVSRALRMLEAKRFLIKSGISRQGHAQRYRANVTEEQKN